MRKISYSPKEVRSLKDIRYQKAHILIEMEFLHDRIHQQTHGFLNGGMKWGMIASSRKILLKGWNWIQTIIKKKKENKAV